MVPAAANRQAPMDHGEKADGSGFGAVADGGRQSRPILFRGESGKIGHRHSNEAGRAQPFLFGGRLDPLGEVGGGRLEPGLELPGKAPSGREQIPEHHQD